MATKVIPESEINTHLKELPAWELVKSSLPESASSNKMELKRIFKFDTFQDSITYINQMAEKVEEFNHHPRFESSHVKLTIWLSTVDLDYKLTDLDFEVAASLEKLYQKK